MTRFRALAGVLHWSIVAFKTDSKGRPVYRVRKLRDQSEEQARLRQ